MTALAPIPDDRTTASRLLVALVLAVAVAGAMVAPATAASTAQDDGDVGVTRSGDALTVDVTDLSDRPETVTVAVSEPNSTSSDPKTVSNGTAEVSIETLISGVDDGESLVGATVQVTAGNETYEDAVDLHTVTFAADDVPVWIDGDDPRIVLPLNASETVGITGNDTVAVTADDAALEGAVRADGTQLTIPQSELREAVGSSADVGLEVSVADGHSTSRTLEPELRETTDGLVLWQPLLETGSSYSVTAERTADGTRYVNAEAEPVRPGEIDLSSLTGVSEARVSVSSEDETLLDGRTVSLDRFSLSATVADGGSAVTFDQGVDGLGVRGVVIDSSTGSIERYAFDGGHRVEDGRLALGNATATANDSLVIATNAGVGTVTLSAAPSEQDPAPADESGLLETILGFGTKAVILVVPALVGPAVGYGAYRFRNEWTGDRLKISSVVAVGFALALALVLVETVGGGLLPEIDSLWPPNELTPHALAVVGVLLGAALAPVTYSRLGFRAGADAGGFTFDVTVTDGDRPLDGRTTIGYRRIDGGDTKAKSTTITGGTGRISVSEPGSWNVAAKRGEHDSEAVTVSRRKTSATLPIAFPATISVTDRDGGDPIAGATVTRTDDGTSRTTDATGTVSLEPGEPGSNVDVEIAHDKYENRTETVAFTQDGDRTVALSPRTGRVRLRSRVDGVPISSTPLRLTPREQSLRDRYGTISVTTGRDGSATRDGLLIGQYRAEIDPPAGRDDLFDGGKSIVTVREDRSTTAEVDAGFTWSLSSAQRSQIDRLRQRVRSLSDHAGRDTTIPQYYGTVVTRMLDAVESLPEAGHLFADGGTDPDVVADALLAAAADSVDAINDAMTTKRNVDLFAACADMSAAAVEWDGECDLETLLERLDSDAMTQRNALKDRYETVTSRVEAERGSVSEAAPAEEMLRHAWDLGNDAGRGDDAIVTIHAALLLLDAVDAVFEHDALCDRLSRTVF
ncbi:hypothetical protein [Natrinema salaciae]|uniref:Carboxypeptidase regulatory-like domain-containing protein n=1 Tax=Natrinema salaciae TaxID=1186196 RepID=A0A1H9NQ61_9EURY|nr:hypothetical protein [Natrinema salaciae]SER37493.1 hypothetical protein SAMN04489841_3672 [Natrinema salaciae]